MAQGNMKLMAKIDLFWDLKATTLSVMIFSGQPNLERKLHSRNWIMVESLACLHGMASIHLVK